MTTHIPADPSPSAQWGAREFSQQFAYDSNFGRVKEVGYPSGEFVMPTYDGSGRPLAETQLLTSGIGTTYRRTLGFNERNQVVDQELGNGIEERSCYDLSTGMMLATVAAPTSSYPAGVTGCPSALPSAGVRLTNYSYDQFLNLAQQSKQFWNSSATAVSAVAEGFAYDDLQRLRSESRTYSSNLAPNGSLSETYNYDVLGNLVTKSDYQLGAAYSYQFVGVNGAILPHAVSAVGAMGFGYDANGNQVTATLNGAPFRTLTYDLEDRPASIVQGNWPTSGSRTRFSYTPDGDRYLQRVEAGQGNTRTVYYVDKAYERTDWDQAASEERTYLAAAVVEQTGGQSVRTVLYQHPDRLGSPDAVTNGSGAIVEGRGFDAWGAPRGVDWQSTGGRLFPGTTSSGKSTTRGFTGQEHLDDTQLIHMNGRVYDPLLGRFLTVDPVISNPMNAQSLNAYSYIGNNPLSGVDPTGYQTECVTQTGSHVCGAQTIGMLSGTKGESGTVHLLVRERNGSITDQGEVRLNTSPSDLKGPGDTGRSSSGSAEAPGKGAESPNLGKLASAGVLVGGGEGAGGVARANDCGQLCATVEGKRPPPTQYTAWSLTFGMPLWKGWGITYTETTVGRRMIFALGPSFGKTTALFGLIGFSRTAGVVLPSRGPDEVAASSGAHSTLGVPTTPAGVSESSSVKVLSGWGLQFYGSLGAAGAVNRSLSEPPPGASPYSVEAGIGSPGLGVGLSYGLAF